MRVRQVMIALAPAVFLIGCGGAAVPTATETAHDIEASVEQVSEVVTVTGENDPNDMIGRDSGYEDAAVLKDERLECGGDRFGTDCGAMIEVWADEEAAAARDEYISTIHDAAPILGSEYRTVDGRTILRVSGELTPEQAEVYTSAFTD